MKRATLHNGRKRRNGQPFSKKHNDRNFTDKSQRLDKEKQKSNIYIHRYSADPKFKNLTFEEAEKKFYIDTFKLALDKQNEKHIKSRHKDRVKTMEEYIEKNPCEETIFQIGKMEDTIPAETFKKIFLDYIEWHTKTFPKIKILDVAIHCEEAGAIYGNAHGHIRQQYVAINKDGDKIISQNKAFEQMGIDRPDPSKKKDRYNNPKMTYTKICREKQIEICEKYGITIEKEPAHPSKKSMDLMEYQYKKETEKLETLKNKVNKISEIVEEIEEIIPEEDIAEIKDLLQEFNNEADSDQYQFTINPTIQKSKEKVL